jgi:hypothetical protein
VPVVFASVFGDSVTALLIASIPGILVALLTQYLNVRHENAVERQLVANAQMLLALEIEDNQRALDAFWADLNVLDKDGHAGEPDAHLEALVTSGLLNQTPPHWSSVRWQRISPRALAELSRKDLAVVDQTYRDLERVGDLFGKLVTLTAEEKKYLDDGGRWWPQRYVDIRKDTYARLDATVRVVATAANPLTGRMN